MKKLIVSLILTSVLHIAATPVNVPNLTPGATVTADDWMPSYDILDSTTPADKKRCEDLESCYARCAKNEVIPGSKVPCFSKTTYKLLETCNQACRETKNYVTPQPPKSFDEGIAPLIGFDGTCSTIYRCVDFYTKKLGWPYQCAHIYCAYVDPEDSRVRSFSEEIPDPKHPVTKQPLLDKGFDDEDTQLPRGFRQSGNLQ